MMTLEERYNDAQRRVAKLKYIIEVVCEYLEDEADVVCVDGEDVSNKELALLSWINMEMDNV